MRLIFIALATLLGGIFGAIIGICILMFIVGLVVGGLKGAATYLLFGPIILAGATGGPHWGSSPATLAAAAAAALIGSLIFGAAVFSGAKSLTERSEK